MIEEFKELVKMVFGLNKKKSKVSFGSTITENPDNLCFPSKTGQDASACISLLDLYGSLFCLDNYNILFEDSDGNKKVIKPLKVLPPTKRSNLDAYEIDDGFAIHYNEHDYFYQAKINVVRIYNNIRIKLEDIKQPVFGIAVGSDGLIIVNQEED